MGARGLILSIILTVALPYSAYGSCALILQELQEKYGDPSIDLGLKGSSQKVVVLIGPIPNSHGDLYGIRRIGSSWTTDFGLNFYDPQGNPQWPTYLFGKKASEVLGFATLDSTNTRMTIPSLNYLNHVLDQANKTLPENLKTRIRFYLDYPSKTKLTEYLQNYRTKAELPMVDVNVALESALHDLSFHLPSVILPNAILESSQNLTEKILEFTDQMAAHYKGTPDEALAKQLKTQIRFTWVRYLDVGTARVIISVAKFARLSSEQQQDPEVVANIFTNVLPFLLGRDNINLKSPDLYKGSKLGELFGSISQYNGFTSVFNDAITYNSELSRGDKPANWDLIAKVKQLVKTDEFWKFENDFFAKWKNENPKFRENQLPPLKSLCMEMSQKRQALIEALEKLL